MLKTAQVRANFITSNLVIEFGSLNKVVGIKSIICPGAGNLGTVFNITIEGNKVKFENQKNVTVFFDIVVVGY